MNVESRKLFANRDARRKLAEMGGIMASSPELLGEAQIYANGGGVQVEQYVAVIPGINEGRPIRLTAETLSRLQQSQPEIMQQATVMDQGTAEQQGVDVMQLRPGDAFVERVLNDSGIADQAPVELPAGPSIRDQLSQSYTIGPIEALGNQLAAQGPAGTPTAYGVPAPGEGLGVETFGQGNIFTNQGTTAGGPGMITPEAALSEVEKLRRQYRPSQGERPTDVDFSDPTLAGLTQPPFVEQRGAALSETEKLRRQYRPSQGERTTDLDFSDPTLAGLTQPPFVAQQAVSEAAQPSPAMTEADAQMQAYAESLVDPEMAAEMQAINQGAKDFGSWLISPKQSSGLISTEEAADKISDVVGGNETPEAPTMEELAKASADEAAAARDAAGITSSLKEPGGPPAAGAEQLTQQVEQIATSDEPATTKSNNAANTLLSGYGITKPGETLSPKETVSKYEQLFKEMLGEDDEEASKEMWHNMAMIGFAIAAGESPRALQNIANGLLAGTKMMKEDRAAKKKRDDTIKMLAIEAGLEDTRSAEKFARDRVLAGMRASGKSRFEAMPTLTEAIDDAAKAEMQAAANVGRSISYPEAVKLVSPAVRKLYGVSPAAPDAAAGGTDPNREAIGNALGL